MENYLEKSLRLLTELLENTDEEDLKKEFKSYQTSSTEVINVYKKGDWVKCSNGGIYKFDPIFCQISKIEGFWKPKENEICWFWNMNQPKILGTLIRNNLDNSFLVDVQGFYNETYLFSEPFFGEKPFD